MLTITSVDKDMEDLDLSYSARGMQNGTVTLKKWSGRFL